MPGTDCQAQPYQPCGEEPRPNTDGTSCVSGYADYDGDPANGCEAGSAEPEDDTVALDGTAEGWIVPSDDTDRFTLAVSGAGASCGPLVVMLEAPPGMDLRLDVAVGNTGIGNVDVAGGEADVVRIDRPVRRGGQGAGRALDRPSRPRCGPSASSGSATRTCCASWSTRPPPPRPPRPPPDRGAAAPAGTRARSAQGAQLRLDAGHPPLDVGEPVEQAVGLVGAGGQGPVVVDGELAPATLAAGPRPPARL